MTYAKKRYLNFFAITIFTLVLPFITINGNHMLLLSFDRMEFHFLGFAFEMQELYIMPFLLMILFIGIFATTAIGGRIWCGWACPQTIFRVIYRDLIESKIFNLRRIKNKVKDVDYSKTENKIKKILSISLFGILSLIIATNFMWYFIPPEDFFRYMQEPKDHVFMVMFIVTVALFLVYDIVFTKEHFCTYVCPYSRIQSVLYDDNTIQAIYNTNRGGEIYKNGEKTIFKAKQLQEHEECTACEACVKICPTGIDIRKGLQVECINCLECVDACTSVMGKLGKKTLVDWGSTNEVINDKKTNYFSIRNIMYYVAIGICFVLLVISASKKEYFLLNVNKTTKLYNIKEDGHVTNNYLLTIQNRDKKAYTFDIKILDNKNFTLKRFKPFKLGIDKRVKKVLILETKKRLFLSDKKDTPIDVKIVMFAKENPKEVFKEQTISFIYPRNDSFK
ncbi:cytochrome c oxidase accessory protein [Malaciobacter marinus]|uniref:Cytochrome c oxidase accessory protein n=1 Tax=Malaciobacter marinus TaxID=505249 RepID=A0A347TGV9_9BACT|nr:MULTISPECIES: cytochrome c oxidase accessory protein CcoG [Malaciobacter]AXX85837.1 cytochrome c oxidase accessory protein [Malaciobacter marinus]PHO12851.1 cytochrome c oxidase accessory protein CcoG [Malaciobacter marinus]PHO14057.1 cytochrome c oxidase accessory protein CcoG [Malaciobacter marinus]RYA24361.1 cytochrome c oxidase accessory protein CcoG [Malaciobacter halophilus]